MSNAHWLAISSLNSGDNDGVSEWSEPRTLGGTFPPVPQFDSALLPASLRPMVEDVANRMQVPIDFPAVTSIAALAGAVNRRASIQPKARDVTWVVIPNLWGGLIAPPGLMKSPVIQAITKPLRQYEAKLRAEYGVARSLFEEAKTHTELERETRRATSKIGKRSGYSRPSTSEALQEPVPDRLLTSDATFECLHQLLSQNPAGLFVLRDELTGFLAGLERPNREQERAFYLECWNGDQPFTIDRVGRGSIYVPNACISLFGAIQPSRLLEYISDALKGGPSNDGLIQRFQLVAWPEQPSNWIYVDATPNVYALGQAHAMYTRLASFSAVAPPLLRFSPDAQELFVAWMQDLENNRIRRRGISVGMQAHLHKFRKLMPALSLLFSLADEESDSVSLSHAQRAADCCEYFERHAERMYWTGVNIVPAAAALSRKLVYGDLGQDGQFSYRDLSRKKWRGLTEDVQIRAALIELQQLGWIKQIKGGGSEVYGINPFLEPRHAGI